MISRTAFCSAQPAHDALTARHGPMPATSVSRSGLASMISKVSSPKAATMRLAMAGPMPRIWPEARYFSIPSAPVGGVALSISALNWRPCVRSLTQAPVAVIHSPAPIDGRVSDHGDEVALAPRLHLEDAEAVLGVVEGDALDRARQSLKRGPPSR